MGIRKSDFIVYVQLIILLSTFEATAQECAFYQELVEGQEYYIYSPSYPKDTQETYCIWDLRTVAGSNVYLSCEVDIAWSQNCNRGKLSISPTGNRLFTDAKIYCGPGSFSLYSKGTDISVELRGTLGARVGKFVCMATVIKNTNATNLATNQRIEDNNPSSCDCGWKQLTRIVGGVETGVHEFAWMSSLIYLGQVYCGASIISDRFLLTAAHCVLRKDVHDFKLLVGDHNLNTGSDTSNSGIYNLDAYEIYPGYIESPEKNDIAILRTSTTITLSPSVGPVCLPFRYTYSTFDGQSVYIVGWGQVEFNGPNSNTLQKAQVDIVSRQQCTTMQDEKLTDGDICTYSEDRDSCQSDSGGPLLWFDTSSQRYQLIGIISHGVGCASGYPGINTRVTEYLKWIISRTNTSYCIK